MVNVRGWVYSSMVDVIIAGAGPTGLLASLALAKIGVLTAIADPILRLDVDPVPQKKHQSRTTAHLPEAVEFLKELGVWEAVAPRACPLNGLEIYNAPSPRRARTGFSKTSFNPRDLQEENFGYNISVSDSTSTMLGMIKNNPNIKILANTKISNIIHNNNSIRAIFDSGKEIDCKLLIGADGANSSVKKLANIKDFTINTQQTAISFHVKHDRPHGYISNEIYTEGGPFTTIPLRDSQERSSAIVWMCKTEELLDFKRLGMGQLVQQIERASQGVLGKILSVSDLDEYPIFIQIARQLVGKRIVLIGEAAHLLPPIGAQGFNQSVRDVMILRNLVSKSNLDLGSDRLLQKYQKQRFPDVMARAGVVGILNYLAWTNSAPLRILRSEGLKILKHNSQLRKLMMEMGLTK